MVPQRFCELHIHIEGCIWKEHLINWWDKSQFLFPPFSYFSSNNNSTFDIFLKELRFGYNFLNTLEAYREVFRLYIEYAKDQNIGYAEIQINLALINTWKIDLIRLLKEVNSLVENDLVLRYIIDLPWQFPISMFEEIINSDDVYKNLGVVGIGFGGDEKLANPKNYSKFIKQFKKAGFKILCHAGETTSRDFSKWIIDEVNPDRIAHGLSIISEISTSPESFPPLDICLTSNLKLNIIDSIEEHPVKKIISTGNGIFTLSTDDPAIFDTNLKNEFQLASKIKGFSKILNNINEYWEKSAFDLDGVKSVTKYNED